MRRPGLPLKAVIAAVIGGALVPTTILFALLWQGTMNTSNDGAGGLSVASTLNSGGATSPEIALSSPERIEVKAGEQIDFPLAIDATEKLPSRSVVAVSAMPDGASFSEGRPYGATGWSLRPDEIGELRFRLPNAQSGAFDMRIELLAADGAVLAQSETRLNITAAPAEANSVSAVESSPFDQSAGMDAPKASEALSAPKRAPSAKVATVKVVTIKPAAPSRPHDGAFALGAAGDAPAEWVEIIRPVDMHARPEQASETVKVVEKGLKFRVARGIKIGCRLAILPRQPTAGFILAFSSRRRRPRNSFWGSRGDIMCHPGVRFWLRFCCLSDMRTSSPIVILGVTNE